MINIQHRPIKRFSLDGSIYDDAEIWRLKNEYISLLIMEMKISGHVPRLNIAPEFTMVYNEKTETFYFKLSIYGIYVGKRKSEWILGIDGQSLILIPQNKSNVFSSEVA
jgi:hypothetical protein